jgi:hypothetical protein
MQFSDGYYPANKGAVHLITRQGVKGLWEANDLNFPEESKGRQTMGA